MNKKNKDFFEKILNDVRPLKKKKNSDLIKNDEIDFQKKSLNRPIMSKSMPEENRVFQKSLEKKLKFVQHKIETNETNFTKKLKKGKIKIDKKIDLHGYRLYEAENIFDKEIEHSYNQEKRCILFITGKGLGYKKSLQTREKLYFGKIRASISAWSQKDNNQNKILYFMQAHSSHGGDGSFYVYLRKKGKH